MRSTIFTGYNAEAENSANITAGGELLAMLDATQTHKMCAYFIQQARAGWVILMAAYTFGLLDICEHMQQAQRRGARCIVIADRGQGVGKSTRDMLQNLKAMQACGVEIGLVNSKDIQGVYSEAGRSVRPGRGIMHSKTIFAAGKSDFSGENYCVVGSTNWTISSLCNFEMSVLLQLTQQAGSEWFDRIMHWPSVIKAAARP